MESMPQHRKGIQNDLDKAYDEAHRDNEAMVSAEEGTHVSDEYMRATLSAEEKAMIAGEEAASPEFDYESINPANVQAFELPNMIGKSLAKVSKFIKAKYVDEYYVPGVEYRDYLIKSFVARRSERLSRGGSLDDHDPVDSMGGNPEEGGYLRSGKTFYFFGGEHPRWPDRALQVPWLRWNDSGWSGPPDFQTSLGFRSDEDWSSHYRAVLIKK